MATLQTIVNDAFRECGVTAVGDAPDSNEFNEGFYRLQFIIYSLFGNEMGDNLTDINLGTGNQNASGKALDTSAVITSLYVPSNIRLQCNLTAPTSVYLDPAPHDGARFNAIDLAGNFATNPLTVYGNGRLINTGAGNVNSIVLNTNSSNTGLFFNAATGVWAVLDVSSSALASPFPNAFDDYLTLLLAKRLAPRYGGEWTDTHEEDLRRQRRTFRARFKQPTEASSEYALIRLSSNGNGVYSWVNPSALFTKGLL